MPQKQSQQFNTHVPVSRGQLTEAQQLRNIPVDPSDSTQDRLLVYPEVNQQFKNYRELCRFLQIPDDLRGDSLIAQQSELRRFFTWDKQGNQITVTKVLEVPEPRIDFRGRSQGLTPSEYLFNTILLYLFKYAPKDAFQYDYASPNCVSFSQTDLKQACFKLINVDYYKLRDVYKKKKKDRTNEDNELITFDRQVTAKVSRLLKIGLERLEKESLVSTSKRYYIYYQDLMALDEGHDKIMQRPATDEEITMILDAGYETLEELNDKYLSAEATDPSADPSTDSTDLMGPKASEASVPDIRRMSVFDKARYINTERLKKLNKQSYVAEERGELWVNIVEKLQVFTVSDACLSRELTKRQQTLNGRTMPQAQLDLNTMMLNWVDEHSVNWSIGKDLINGNSTAIVPSKQHLDMKEFADAFIDIKRKELCYNFKEKICMIRTSDQQWFSTRIMLHYASNKMVFNLSNLSSGIIGPRDVSMVCLEAGDEGRYRIATNDPQIMTIIVDYAKDYEAFPIEGYIGGFTTNLDDSNGSNSKATEKESTDGCLIFKFDYEEYQRVKKLIDQELMSNFTF